VLCEEFWKDKSGSGEGGFVSAWCGQPIRSVSPYPSFWIIFTGISHLATD